MSAIDLGFNRSMRIGGNFKIRFSGKLKASTQLVGKENIAEVEAEKPIERMIESVHQEPTKLLIHRQSAKEIKQLDGPLKNWAIFYGRSPISPEIPKMLEGVSRLLYTPMCDSDM